MPRSNRHLSIEERSQVEILKKSGLSKDPIVQHPSINFVRTTPALGRMQGVALQGGSGEWRIHSTHLRFHIPEQLGGTDRVRQDRGLSRNILRAIGKTTNRNTDVPPITDDFPLV